MDKLLKKNEVAEYFQVSMGKVESMMKSGLPYIKDGGNVRFHKEHLDRYVHSKTTENR